MSEPYEIRPLKANGPVATQLVLLSKGLAIAGGMLFVVLIVMSLISIVGRKLGFGSVNGDIELMQAGSAVAAAAFLPYCTMLGEHVKVDFFTENMRPSLKRNIDALADLLLAVMAGVIAWRTGLSVLSIKESNEVTTLVSLPVWIPVAAMVPSFVLMTACGLYRFFFALVSRTHQGKVAA